jgi:hypothetical protein
MPEAASGPSFASRLGQQSRCLHGKAVANSQKVMAAVKEALKYSRWQ